MTTHILTLILIVLVWSGAALAQRPDSTDGTVFIEEHVSFVLKEPLGWVLDVETAKVERVQAVLYREGSSWRDGVAVMYVRVIHKDETQPTIAKVIANDVAQFLKASKESTISDSPSIQTRDKKNSVVKVFYDAANKNFESVAFIDEAKVVVIIALSSREKGEYEKAVPAFDALVGSYSLFAPLVRPADD
ncbi:MAG TPA: hypothetical protein VGW58_05440 [Pyrinomonadaceae bacterium]|nr:hypothetical protein [Pyrinomonadaceae bacterium]